MLIYEPLITKSIFDACQAIREGRSSKKAISETKEQFLLRGLIKCAVSSRTVTCDLKKGKYVYLICRNPADGKKKMWIKENIVLDQIREVFRSIQIQPSVLAGIMNHLKNTHESEKAFHHDSIKSLHRESEEIARRQDRLTDLLLDESITKDAHNNKLAQLINRQQEINQLLEQHHAGNEQFKIALSSLINLASHAYELFESSTIDEKRQLIGYVFSNLELKGGKLEYALKKPFNLFVDLANNQDMAPWAGFEPATN